MSLAAALSALLPFTKDIVQMTAFSGSLYGACFVPVLAIGIFLRKRSEIAAIVTMVVGSIAVIGAFTLRKLEIWTTHEVYIGMMCGLITFAVLQWRWAVPIKPTNHE